jgi:hypothetical protein
MVNRRTPRGLDFRHVIWPRNRSYGDRGLCDGVEWRNVSGDARQQTAAREKLIAMGQKPT